MKRLIFAALLLAACGAESPDTGATSDASSPGVDADASPLEPDAAPLRSCSATDPCSGETICITNQCEPAWDRDYRVWIYSAEVPPLDPGGALWDTDSAPDLYVRVSIGETPNYTTQTVRDDFSAEFTDESFIARNVLGGATVTFYVADDDSNPAHPSRFQSAFGCELTVTVDLVDPSRGGGGIACSAALDLGAVVAKIEPL